MGSRSSRVTVAQDSLALRHQCSPLIRTLDSLPTQRGTKQDRHSSRSFRRNRNLLNHRLVYRCNKAFRQHQRMLRQRAANVTRSHISNKASKINESPLSQLVYSSPIPLNQQIDQRSSHRPTLRKHPKKRHILFRIPSPHPTLGS